MNQLSPIKRTVVGVQFLFVAFGATVLVPLLTGIQPAVALFTAGIGTFLFHLITKGKVPVYLGSSFAFVAPIIACTAQYGLPATFSGLMAVGLVYGIFSAIIKINGLKIIEKLFPSVVVGPVIVLIGLSLAPAGINMIQVDPATNPGVTVAANWCIALSALATAVIITTAAKGMLKLIPIFCGIIVGYVVAIFFGYVDFTKISEAAWFEMPKFVRPEFSWGAIVYMIPVAIAPLIEHVGDMYAISAVADKDFVKEPGLHRTLLGDGIATALAGLFGGPPNTTYSEVTGAISLTKVTDPSVLRITAGTAIIFAFCGKINGFLQSIPPAVLGGIMILLFGMIASVGIKTLVDSKTDINMTRNQVIISIVLCVGIGGAKFVWGDFTMAGIGLASVVGVLLNLVLPKESKPVHINK